MMAFQSMSYWDVYKLPVPFRKWLILRYNKYAKQQDKKSGEDDTDRPMSQEERVKYIQRSKQQNKLVQKQPPNHLMQSRRNI